MTPDDADAIAAKFPIGTPVKVSGVRGDFKVKGYNKDGSLLLYGGMTGHGAFRAFTTNRVRKVKVRS